MTAKNVGKMFFWGKVTSTLCRYPGGLKISLKLLYLTPSHTQNSRWPPKTTLGKIRQQTLQIPWGSKVLSKSLYLALFPRYVHFCVLRRNSRWPPKIVDNDFWGKSPVDSADTLEVKNFIKIPLACTVSVVTMYIN